MIRNPYGMIEATKDSGESLATFIMTAANFGDALLAYCMINGVDLSKEAAICSAAKELASKRGATETDAVIRARCTYEDLRSSEEWWDAMMKRSAKSNR